MLRKLIFAVIAYLILAVIVTGFRFIELLAKSIVEAVMFLAVLAGAGALLGLIRKPPDDLIIIVRNGWPMAAAATLTFVAGMAAFSSFKHAIPWLVPFYLDPWLAEIDAALHLGDPGLFLHRVIPEWLGMIIALLYGPVWFVALFGGVLLIALQPRRDLQSCYFGVMFVSFVVLGNILATLTSSCGPIFYEQIYGNARYLDLMSEIRSSFWGEQFMAVPDYLMRAYRLQHTDTGVGISAMPSMHLAIATLNALALSSFGRGLAIVGWVYVSVIEVGSVYLAWHYAIDGYISIIFVVVAWHVAVRYLATDETRPGFDAAPPK